MSAPGRKEKRVLSGVMLTALVWAAPVPIAFAQQSAIPDFSSNQAGWVGVGGGFGVGGEVFSAVAGQLPPLHNDPAHPFVPNGAGRSQTIGLPTSPIRI